MEHGDRGLAPALTQTNQTMKSQAHNRAAQTVQSCATRQSLQRQKMHDIGWARPAMSRHTWWQAACQATTRATAGGAASALRKDAIKG